MPAKPIALEEFSRVFSYNPETGEITWKAASGRGRLGDMAGTPKVVHKFDKPKIVIFYKKKNMGRIELLGFLEIKKKYPME